MRGLLCGDPDRPIGDRAFGAASGGDLLNFSQIAIILSP